MDFQRGVHSNFMKKGISMKITEIEERTAALAEPVILALGAFPVDTEYVKEGSDWYLRVYADKDGGITINDCVDISRALEKELDREDFIKDPYILEVSSPGLTRKLKKEKDYLMSIGKRVDVKLYRPIDKEKQFEAELIGYEGGFLKLKKDDESIIEVDIKDISSIRLAFVQ